MRLERPALVSALNQLAVYRGLVQWPEAWERDFPDGVESFVTTDYSDADGWPSRAAVAPSLERPRDEGSRVVRPNRVKKAGAPSLGITEPP